MKSGGFIAENELNCFLVVGHVFLQISKSEENK